MNNHTPSSFLELLDTTSEELHLLAKEHKIGLVHIHDAVNPKGGISVAFSKQSPYTNGRMVVCAVQSCSHSDAFSRKIGARGALLKYFKGETVVLPIMKFYADEDLNLAVKTAFTALYYAVN